MANSPGEYGQTYHSFNDIYVNDEVVDTIFTFDWFTDGLKDFFYWAANVAVDFGAFLLDKAADTMPTFQHFQEMTDVLGPAPAKIISFIAWSLPMDVIAYCLLLLSGNYVLFYSVGALTRWLKVTPG